MTAEALLAQSEWMRGLARALPGLVAPLRKVARELEPLALPS